VPKYLVQAAYTLEGAKGLLKDGGSKRRAAVQEMLKAIGGTVEAFYYAFGDSDAFVILDVPDHVTATALALAVNASGAVRTKTTVLITPEEVDQAIGKAISYRAPGQK
jgi:uncharacterized protein with GYD domain